MLSRKSCKYIFLILLTSLVSCATPASLPGETFAPASTPSQTIQSPVVETLTKTQLATPKPVLLGTPVAPSPTPAAPATQLPSNLKVWAEDLRREGNAVKVMVCFELPDDADWVVDQAVLRYAGGEVSFTSAEWLELQPPPIDGEKGYRCQELGFTVPGYADLTSTDLIINRLIAYPGEGEINNNNIFPTVQGSWTFPFENPPFFIFDPLPYRVKAEAMNLRQEGDTVKVDVCFQMDNTDWETWQVQEGILQYAGQEDRYYGTAAWLNRVSPPNARIRQYCGTLEGSPNFTDFPAATKPSDFSLTITSLIPVVDSSNLCTTYLQRVQEKLDEHRLGIQVQCGKTRAGSYGIQAANMLDYSGVSQSGLERIFSNVGLFSSLTGPWTFNFK